MNGLGSPLRCRNGGDRVGRRGPAAVRAGRRNPERLRLQTQCLQLSEFPVCWIKEAALGGPGSTEYFRAGHITCRMMAAERDESDGTAGHLHEHLRAVGVAGHVWVLNQRRGHRAYLADVLAGEPAELVELVHPHVDGDATAVCTELHRRRLLIPLVTRDEVDSAEATAVNSVPELPQRRNEPAPVSHLQRHPGRCGDLTGEPGLLGAHPARLLAQDRQPGRGDLPDDRPMLIAGSRDEHSVQGGTVQHLCHVGVQLHARPGQPFPDPGQGFSDRGDRHRAGPCEGTQVGAPHPARTDESEPEDGRHSQSQCGQARAVIPLILGGLNKTLGRLWQDVLLDHEPTRKSDRAQPVEHVGDIQVPPAEHAECFA